MTFIFVKTTRSAQGGKLFEPKSTEAVNSALSVDAGQTKEFWVGIQRDHPGAE